MATSWENKPKRALNGFKGNLASLSPVLCSGALYLSAVYRCKTGMLGSPARCYFALRQPAAIASASLQNQRSPRASSMFVWS